MRKVLAGGPCGALWWAAIVYPCLAVFVLLILQIHTQIESPPICQEGCSSGFGLEFELLVAEAAEAVSVGGC